MLQIKSSAFILIVLHMLMITGCASVVEDKHSYREVGIASYYAESLHGRKTASGERYNMRALTAAHKKLPFGTVVVVTNLKNNKSIKVRINDRGPFVKGRVIDLSTAAAKKIGLLNDGIAKVKIVVIN